LAGRGAWSAIGGTLNYEGDGRGPYYRLATGSMPQVGSEVVDNNSRAVHGAVKAYQKALNRRLGAGSAKADGIFGAQTERAVKRFQSSVGETADGVIGPNTSKALLWPDLRRKVNNLRKKYPAAELVTPVLVCGFVQHESGWDAGAVGFQDEDDVGLAQINADAHPEMSFEERLAPIPCFEFIFMYIRNALRELGGNIVDAIVSYNLGLGGARTWIRAGRPDIYTPPGSTTPRDMKHYYQNIRNVCKDMR
jgi:peptidoglycan hydrolase-like protein with peptidoglycan-binding domain